MIQTNFPVWLLTYKVCYRNQPADEWLVGGIFSERMSAVKEGQNLIVKYIENVSGTSISIKIEEYLLQNIQSSMTIRTAQTTTSNI